jgi:hypothetical protein
MDDGIEFKTLSVTPGENGVSTCASLLIGDFLCNLVVYTMIFVVIDYHCTEYHLCNAAAL